MRTAGVFYGINKEADTYEPVERKCSDPDHSGRRFYCSWYTGRYGTGHTGAGSYPGGKCKDPGGEDHSKRKTGISGPLQKRKWGTGNIRRKHSFWRDC